VHPQFRYAPYPYQGVPEAAAPQPQPNYGAYPQQQAPYGNPVAYSTDVHRVIPPRSVGVAYLLWFFLGWFGVHHFYLNRTGWGVAYLLVTVLLGWTGVGLLFVGLGCLVDLFRIRGYTRQANLRLTGYRF